MTQVSECVMLNAILPQKRYSQIWDSIVVDPSVKERLLRGMALSLNQRAKLPFEVTALHGLMLLYGPPGTGKTTLARGAAQQLCAIVPEERVRLLEVNIHGLVSGGRDPMAIYDLLCEYIPQLTESKYPTVMVLDEVESIAVSRGAASLSANSADVHRATNAVLAALDRNAIKQTKLITIATSNFVGALDEAFQSRVDTAIEMPLPDQKTVAGILSRTLQELAPAYPDMMALSQDHRLMRVAEEIVGADGRQIRKLVTEAMAVRMEVVKDPNLLSLEDMLAAGQHIFSQPSQQRLDGVDITAADRKAAAMAAGTGVPA